MVCRVQNKQLDHKTTGMPFEDLTRRLLEAVLNANLTDQERIGIFQTHNALDNHCCPEEATAPTLSVSCNNATTLLLH